MKNKIKFTLPIIALIILILSFIASLSFGASGLGFTDMLKSFFDPDSVEGRILWYVRFPRTICTIMSGAALAVAGALIQSVLYNPLASPNIIGVNAGAGLGTVLCLAFIPAASAFAVGGAAFLGAIAATAVVYLISKGAGLSKMSLVLAGIAVSSLFTAAIDTITTLVPDCLPASNQFKIGGAANVTFEMVIPLLIIVPVGIILSMLFHHELDLLSLGNETAKSLGVDPKKWRLFFLGLSCLLAAGAVSVMGLIGFVGLIVPHIVKMLAGSENRNVIPLCALFGASFVTICDLGARTIFAPFEIPVGILLSFLGAPFFLYLLIRRRIHD